VLKHWERERVKWGPHECIVGKRVWVAVAEVVC